MSDFYPYMEQHNNRFEELAARAAEDRLAKEVVRARRAAVREQRQQARTVRGPVFHRLRALLHA